MIGTVLLSLALAASAQPDRGVNLRVWAEMGQVEAIERLLAGNELVDVDVPDAQGWTALMYAAKSNQAAIAELLLRAGADHRLTSDFGETALHVAAREGSTEVAGVLLEAGANLRLRDSEGRTPLFRAVNRGRADVTDLLQETARKRARIRHLEATDEEPGEIVPPEILDYVRPEYTESALQQEIQGTVVLKVLVRETGRVGAVRITKSLEPSLDRSAVKAVRRWTFAPARRGGVPLNVVVDVEIPFEPPDQPKG